jgi:hypothetical protein
MLASVSAAAATYVVDVRGTVLSQDSTMPSELNRVVTGDPVWVSFAFETTQFAAAGSDGSSYLIFADGIPPLSHAMRSRVFVGQRLFNVEKLRYPFGFVAEIDNNASLISGLPPDDDAFFILDWSENKNATDPSVQVVRQRVADVLGLAAGTSSFVTSPVTDLRHHIKFSAAEQLQGALSDSQLQRDPSTGVWFSTSQAFVGFTVDKISIHQCKNVLPWLASDAPWPKVVDCED